MPLASGHGSVKQNVQELMSSPIQSESRRKAIKTIARTRGISEHEARFKQALAIATSKAKEGNKEHKLNSKAIHYGLH